MRIAGQLHKRTGAIRLTYNEGKLKRAASIALTARPGCTIIRLYISTHRLTAYLYTVQSDF